MNDFGLIQGVLDSSNQINGNYENFKNLIIAVIIFVIINIITIIVNLILQFKLKNKDKDIIKFNLREGKRIDIQVKLYEFLEELTYYDGIKSEDYLKKSSFINQFLTKNKIYLEKDLINISQELNDYFLSVISDYRKKDFKYENDKLNEFAIIFNK